jgi:hypothetical protein
LASQFFGAEIFCQQMTKNMATDCEGCTKGSIGSQNTGSKPNEREPFTLPISWKGSFGGMNQKYPQSNF